MKGVFAGAILGVITALFAAAPGIAVEDRGTAGANVAGVTPWSF